MAKKVYIEVIVDDKGTTKKVAVDAKKLEKALDGTAKGARTADRNLKGAAKASSNTTKNFSKMAQGAGGLVAIYATLAAQVFAVSAAFNFLKDAGNLEQLKAGQLAYASSTGIAMRTLTKDVIAATDAQISFRDAASATAIGTAAGQNSDQLVRLGKAAKDASIILGRDVTDSFNRLVRGTTKAEPELLDELGIILRLNDATRDYAAILGKSAKDLTSFERTQAVTNDVLTQAEQKYGAILEVIDVAPNQFAQLGKAFDDILNKLKEFANFVAGPLARVLTDNPVLAFAGVGLVIKGALAAAVPSLKEFGSALRETADEAKVSFAESKKATDALLKTAAASPEGMVKARKKASKEITKLLKSENVELGKSHQIRLAMEGKINEISAASARTTLRNIQGNTRAWAGVSESVKANVSKQLTAIVANTQTATNKMAVAHFTYVERAKLGFRQLQTFGVQAYATLTAAAARFAAIASRALSVVGWLGVAFAVYEVARSVFDMNKEMSESEKAAERQAQKLEGLTQKARDLTEEFKNFAKVQKEMRALGATELTLTGNIGSMIESFSPNNLALIKTDIGIISEAFAAMRDNSIEAAPNMRALANELQNVANKKVAAGLGGDISGITETARATEVSNQAGRLERQASQSFADYARATEHASLIAVVDVLEQQKEAFESIDGASTIGAKAAQRYFSQVDSFLSDGVLNMKEYIKAYTQMTALAGEIKALTRITTDAERSISDVFKVQTNKYDDSLKTVNNAIESLLNIQNKGVRLSPEMEKRLDNLQAQADIIKSFSEFDDMRKKRIVEINTLEKQSIRGKTNGQKQVLERQFQELKIQQQIDELLAEEALTRARAMSSGLGLEASDVRKLEINKANVELLKAQLALLKDQSNNVERIAEKMNNAFEGSFEKNLADIIKTDQSSLTDAIRNIAESTLRATGDVLAKLLTEKMMKTFFNQVGPAQTMANAIRTSGEYVAQLWSEAITGSASVPGGGTRKVETDPTPVEPETFWNKFKQIGKDFIGKKAPEGTRTEHREDGSVPAIAKQGKGLLGALDNFTSNIKDVFSPDAPFLESLWNVFRDGGRDLVGVFSGLFKGLGGLFSGGSEGSGGIFSIVASMFTSGMAARAGGIFANGVQQYASGGIASGSGAGYPAMLHGTEAVVPLPNNREIPVQLSGNAGQNNNVTVNVAIDSNGNAQQDSQATSDQGGQLGAVIARAVQQELQNQKRSGGILNPYGAT